MLHVWFGRDDCEGKHVPCPGHADESHRKRIFLRLYCIQAYSCTRASYPYRATEQKPAAARAQAVYLYELLQRFCQCRHRASNKLAAHEATIFHDPLPTSQANSTTKRRHIILIIHIDQTHHSGAPCAQTPRACREHVSRHRAGSRVDARRGVLRCWMGVRRTVRRAMPRCCHTLRS